MAMYRNVSSECMGDTSEAPHASHTPCQRQLSTFLESVSYFLESFPCFLVSSTFEQMLVGWFIVTKKHSANYSVTSLVFYLEILISGEQIFNRRVGQLTKTVLQRFWGG